MSVAVEQKKILILGGGKKQLPLMQVAHSEGYFVILCDKNPNCAGKDFADRQYLQSIADTKAVIDIAQQECVTGIISNGHYALLAMGDATTQLHLMGTSRESVERMGSKFGLRIIQKELGLFSPHAVEASDVDEFCSLAKQLVFPIIIKPSMSCSSQGVVVVQNLDDVLIRKAFLEALSLSVDKRVTAEDFIEAKRDSFFEGEIFVYGRNAYDFGMFSCLRSTKFPLYPSIDVYPPLLTQKQRNIIHDQLQAIFHHVDFTFGIVNIEGMLTKTEEIFFIELNPRQGGGVNSELIKDVSGVDMYRLIVTTAMNNLSYYDNVKHIKPRDQYIINIWLFAENDGEYRGIYIDKSIEKYRCEIREFYKIGEMVSRSKCSVDRIAMVKFRFPSRKTQLDCLFNLEEKVYAQIQ